MKQGSILNRVVAAKRFGVDGSNPKPNTLLRVAHFRLTLIKKTARNARTQNVAAAER